MTEALKRRLGPGLLTAYGVGVMVGAGIYVLVGAVAGEAGYAAPLAFLLAGLVALPSALSYAEFSTRVPEAAGEAAYVETGLGQHGLAVLVGLAIVATGVISAAAVLRGGTGYLVGLVDLPTVWVVSVLGAGLGLVAIAGALESLSLAAIFTVVEVVGLLAVVWAGSTAQSSNPVVTEWPQLVGNMTGLVGIICAVTLAFFAFIGFEDIVNMAEEVRDPARNLPRAIVGALLITTLLYVLVSWAAVRAVAPDKLATSEQPLVLVWQAGNMGNAAILSVIAIAAALNGVLAQIVMASRVLFGLGNREPRLALFHKAHARFGTPVLATVLVTVLVIAAALALPVATLAEFASIVLLTVFVVVNWALIRTKKRDPEAPFTVWKIVPWLGLITALTALLVALGDVL